MRNSDIILKKYKFHSRFSSDLEPVGVDKLSVTSQFGTCNISAFLKKIIQGNVKPLLVLTRRERYILHNYLVIKIKVYVLEELYPFLGIKFISDSSINYKQLLKYLPTFDEYGSIGVINGFAYQCHARIVNKLKTKSSLDAFFTKLSGSGIQEVFCIREQRPNRTIYVLDVNSMYASVMSQEFTNPKELTYRKLNETLLPDTKIERGLYYVEIGFPKSSWINRVHQIHIPVFGKYVHFSFDNQEVIKTWLTSDEIEFYRHHFKRIFLIFGIISKSTIKHPLWKLCNGLYSIRRSLSRQGNKQFADKLKLLLASAYSCTHRYSPETKFFKSKADLYKFLYQEYDLDGSDLAEFIAFRTHRRDMSIDRLSTHYKVTKRKVDDPRNVHSLYYEVIAKARIRLLELIECVSEIPDAQVCYCNIDSIHLSVPSGNEQEFKNKITNLISNKLGDLKIEAVGNKGIWLEPGRYWIYDDHGKVVKNANIGFAKSRDGFHFREISQHLFQSRTHCIPLMRGMDLRTAVRIRGEIISLNSGLDLLDRWSISSIRENVRQHLINGRDGWRLIDEMGIEFG